MSFIDVMQGTDPNLDRKCAPKFRTLSCFMFGCCTLESAYKENAAISMCESSGPCHTRISNLHRWTVLKCFVQNPCWRSICSDIPLGRASSFDKTLPKPPHFLASVCCISNVVISSFTFPVHLKDCHSDPVWSIPGLARTRPPPLEIVRSQTTFKVPIHRSEYYQSLI